MPKLDYPPESYSVVEHPTQRGRYAVYRIRDDAHLSRVTGYYIRRGLAVAAAWRLYIEESRSREALDKERGGEYTSSQNTRPNGDTQETEDERRGEAGSPDARTTGFVTTYLT